MDKDARRVLKREYERRWREENPELARERARLKAQKRRKRLREQLREYDRARYERRRAEIRAKRKYQYALNIGGVRDKAIAAAKERYRTGGIKDRIRVALNAARARAKKRGVEFNLKATDLGLPTHCAATGIEFDMSCSFRNGNIFVPSLDRIDPKIGYVKGNVRVVCHGYNLAKHTGTDSDVLKLARAIVAMAEGREE